MHPTKGDFAVLHCQAHGRLPLQGMVPVLTCAQNKTASITVSPCTSPPYAPPPTTIITRGRPQSTLLCTRHLPTFHTHICAHAAEPLCTRHVPTTHKHIILISMRTQPGPKHLTIKHFRLEEPGGDLPAPCLGISNLDPQNSLGNPFHTQPGLLHIWPQVLLCADAELEGALQPATHCTMAGA
jgi:hypothetical protein